MAIKHWGEPPAIPPAPAIRNAVLHASTGVSLHEIPISPQKLIDAFYQSRANIERRECYVRY